VKRTLAALNELEKQGVFTRYAIGGAMGATFYVEPLLTFDLDVFVNCSANCSGAVSASSSNGSAVTDRRYKEALRGRGDLKEEGECVLIEGVPMQFLPAYNALLEEALKEAQEIMYEDVPTRVLRNEQSACHLSANRTQQGARANFARTGKARCELSCRRAQAAST
jgi:hypothetical protein